MPEEKVDKDKSIQVVYGFGVIKKFHSAVGYRGLKAVDLLKDVLDDNKELNAEQVLTEAYPQIYSRGTFLPIYKYLSLIGIESDESYKRNKLGLNYPLRKRIFNPISILMKIKTFPCKKLLKSIIVQEYGKPSLSSLIFIYLKMNYLHCVVS